MKILSLGLERLVLDKESSVAQRILSYGSLVVQYTIIVPNSKNLTVNLSDNVQAHGVNGQTKFFQLFNIYKFSSNLLKNKQYDLITVQDQYYLALLGWLLAKKYKLALEIQVHGFEKYYGLRKLITRFVLPKADVVRTVSRRLKKFLQNTLNVDESKITVAPIYVKKISIEGNRNYIAKSPFVLLTIARLVPIKNIELQLKALTILVKEFANIELWIVGDGPEKNKLEELSRSLKVDKYVKFYGRRENLENFYKQADCFLLTSNFEGWGMVVVEAAQFGLPIIMTDVGSAGELVINNESGLVIPVNDVVALTEAIKRIIADKDLRQNLGVEAQQKASQLLSWQDTLGLYKKSWEQALQIKTYNT
jgi:teichuronic acid biosynthesis glycosyltransferase TuaC